MHIKTFEASVYIERRKTLNQAMTQGILLFLGNNEAPRNYRDNTYDFRQDSTFLYYFGLQVAGLAATIDLESGETVIYGDELTIDDIVWTGPLPTIAEMAFQVGIVKTLPKDKLKDVIAKGMQSDRKIHYLPSYRGDNTIYLSSLKGVSIDQINVEFSLEFVKAVIKQREIKEDREVEEMHKATLITSEMHLAAMRSGKPGLFEYEVMSHVNGTAINLGGTNSFATILTVRGETLHNHYHGNQLKSGQLVLCDAGAENDMFYCGDMTCTFPVDLTFTQKQKEIYDIVLKSHTESAAILRPGIEYRQVYYHACKVLVEGLKDLGIMKGDSNEAVAAGAHAIVFQCGLGHMIGLDVHDMENLGEQYVGYSAGIERSTQFGMKYLRLAKELKVGHALTVEPGMYFIPTQIDMWKAEGRFADFINYSALETYKDFGGIRIEEDFVITNEGSRLLGTALPKTTQEIEEYRRASLG